MLNLILTSHCTILLPTEQGFISLPNTIINYKKPKSIEFLHDNIQYHLRFLFPQGFLFILVYNSSSVVGPLIFPSIGACDRGSSNYYMVYLFISHSLFIIVFSLSQRLVFSLVPPKGRDGTPHTLSFFKGLIICVYYCHITLYYYWDGSQEL